MNRLSTAVFVCFFVLPGFAIAEVNCETGDPAPSLDVLYSNAKYYFIREPCYENLPIDVGTFVRIDPPTDSFVTLFVATHKELPRIGELVGFDKVAGMDKSGTMKQAILNRFIIDAAIYNNLLVAQFNDNLFTAEAVVAVDKANKPYNERPRVADLPTVPDATGGNYSARLHMQSMLPSGLSEAAANEYFCDSEATADCYTGFVRGGGTVWGGFGASEFAARRAYFRFVEEKLAAIKEWARMPTTDAYFVSPVYLPQYDFDREGYSLDRVSTAYEVGSQSYLRPSKGLIVRFQYQARDNSVQYLDQHGKPTNPDVDLFIPMGPDEAERLQKETPMLYSVIRGETYAMFNRNTTMAAPGSHAYHYGRPMLFDITEPVVEYYSDSLLKNKVGEIRLQ